MKKLVSFAILFSLLTVFGLAGPAAASDKAVETAVKTYPSELFQGKTQEEIKKELPVSGAYRDETTPIEEEVEVVVDGKPVTTTIVRYLTEMEIFQYRGDILWTCIAAFLVFLMQAGFAMVLFSAALKGIPEEILEAARVDGATEIQVFFRIMIPYIQGTLVTVATTIILFTLKIFDVVWVMTGGQFGTHVIATQFYRQSFIARNAGFGSAIAIVLLVAVIPVMVYNLRQFGEQEAF